MTQMEGLCRIAHRLGEAEPKDSLGPGGERLLISRVDGRAGEGATFIITLPKANA